MASLLASNCICSSSCTSSSVFRQRQSVKAVLQVPKLQITVPNQFYLPKLPTRNEPTIINQKKLVRTDINHSSDEETDGSCNYRVISELHMIMESVAERTEMHNNIGEQRNNWNTLFLNSINTITITAATMTGLAGLMMGSPSSLLALKLSSALLYSAATGMLLVMNKIQPSQLAEEQRNAVRFFKQLHGQIQTKLSLSTSTSPPTQVDVDLAMEKVLALDKAYPLPLLGGAMIEKFPKNVEPATWWPQQKPKQDQEEEEELIDGKIEKNGWSIKLEKEMRDLIETLRNRDVEEYVRLSKMFLNINKILAISGPLLTGVAALGSAFVGPSSSHGSAAVLVGVVAGAMATVVNTLEHGGQIGMVFEMYRACAGSFQLLEETIETTLEEREVEKRENGELFEMKVALQLGRSLSDLRNFAARSSSSSSRDEDSKEFTSKLF